MPRRAGGLAAIGLALLLAACASASKRELPDISFADSEPITLAVEAVEVVVEAKPPAEPPHVGQRFIQPLTEIAERWGAARLRAAGTEGRRARYVVVEANAVREEVAGQGLAGILLGETVERYDLSMELRLEILDTAGALLGYAAARGEFSQTVPEGTDEARLRRIWHHMAGQFMEDMDQEMETQIREALPGFVLGEPASAAAASDQGLAFGLPMIARNSRRVASLSRNAPSIRLVTVEISGL